MAQINITTTQEEQELVLKAIKNFDNQVVSVSTLAKWSCLGQSRVRYAIVDLIEAGKVEKVPTRAFNEHYIRYAYKVVE